VTTQVYLTRPTVGVPSGEAGHQGRPPSRSRVLSADKPIAVREVYTHADTPKRQVRVRSTERGEIADTFAVRRVSRSAKSGW
jgi:hypothetical protein